MTGILEYSCTIACENSSLPACVFNRNNRCLPSIIPCIGFAEPPRSKTETSAKQMAHIMKIAQNHTLYNRIKNKGFTPAHVAEVGVHEPESSNIYRFIQDGIRTTLVEPEPTAIAHIKHHFSEKKNVTLHECAACDEDGEIELISMGPSTFLGNLPASPALVNDHYTPDEKDKFTVQGKRFDRIDDGTIEVLSVDTEGSEWYAIKHLVSRPSVISVETHGAAYLNPYLDEIRKWMQTERYAVWYKTKTDTVFVKTSAWKRSAIESLGLILMNLKISLRRARKRRFH